MGHFGAFCSITDHLWWFFLRIFASTLTTTSLATPKKQGLKNIHGYFRNDLKNKKQKKNVCVDGLNPLSEQMKRRKCSLLHFHFRKGTLCGQGRARYPDTANTFSTTGYSITSIATRSLKTLVTHLLDRSATHCIKWNVPHTINRGFANHCWREFVNALPYRSSESMIFVAFYWLSLLEFEILAFLCHLHGGREHNSAVHWGFCVSIDWLDFPSVCQWRSVPSLWWHIQSIYCVHIYSPKPQKQQFGWQYFKKFVLLWI